MALTWDKLNPTIKTDFGDIGFNETLHSKYKCGHTVWCSTVLGIKVVWVCQTILPKNQPHISYTTDFWQYWLGIAKPNNVFRLANVKPFQQVVMKFYLAEFSTNKPIRLAKHNSTMEGAKSLIFHCLTSLHCEKYLFANCCTYNISYLCPLVWSSSFHWQHKVSIRISRILLPPTFPCFFPTFSEATWIYCREFSYTVVHL